MAAFYLHHRLSEDLDFFTEEKGRVNKAKDILNEIAKSVGCKLEINREFETFLECFLIKENEVVKCDFAEDSPYRLKPKILNKRYNIYVDNQLDIACNKFSALFDRHEAKDFVDIYFLSKQLMSFDEIYSNAKKKHVGLDDYWLARSLDYVFRLEKLPKMLKPLNKKEMMKFYENMIAKLMKKIRGS